MPSRLGQSQRTMAIASNVWASTSPLSKKFMWCIYVRIALDESMTHIQFNFYFIEAKFNNELSYFHMVIFINSKIKLAMFKNECIC